MTSIEQADLIAMCTRIRDRAETLYRGEEGLVLQLGNELHTDVLDGERLCEILDEVGVSAAELCSVKSRSAAAALKRRFGFTGEQSCTQWVYPHREPPKVDGTFDIRPLLRKDVELAASHYHNEVDFFRRCVAEKRIWGLYENGVLAGFIGMHDQGSMGMLEVLPEFRRKGYGCALEAYLIELHLRRGWVPYCHVVDGNEASLALQRHLGLSCAAAPAIWVY